MLKKFMLTMFVLLLFTWSDTAFAEKSSVNQQTIEISRKDYHFNYKESIPSAESGWMDGIHLAYRNHNPNTNTYWRVLYEQTNHDSHYTGETWGGTPIQSTTGNKITTTEIIFANPISDEETAYAYTGIGFHSWDRNLKGSGGYLEKYSWKYIPIGYRYEYRINDKWSGAVDAKIRFMFGGKMKALNLDQIDPFQVNLGNKVGFKLEVPYTYKIDSQWSIVVTPWYDYSSIGQSNTVPMTIGGIGTSYVLYEPNSKNHQYGIDLGLMYRF